MEKDEINRAEDLINELDNQVDDIKGKVYKLEDLVKEYGNADEDRKEKVKKATQEIIETITSVQSDALAAVIELFNSEEWKATLEDYENNARELLPHIEKVLASSSKYKGITAEQVLDNMDVLGKTVNPEELTGEILKRAKQKKRAADARESQRKRTEGLELSGEGIKYKNGENLTTSTTKLVKDFFNFAPPVNVIQGQLAMSTAYVNGSKEANVYTYYNFNEAELNNCGIKSREFTHADFFLSMVTDNLFQEGNTLVSPSKLWHELGHTNAPNSRDIQELYNSLVKGQNAIINIRYKEVLPLYKKDVDEYEDIKSPVLPVIIKATHSGVNNSVTNFMIQICARSPFMILSETLNNQITTWKKDILKLYKGKRTKRYYAVLRYLMQEITWMRNDPGRCNIITFSALCDYAQDKTRADKQRTLKMTEDILKEVFIPLNYIKSYRIDTNYGKISLIYDKSKKKALPNKT